jgi:hypothetical protein
MSDLASLYRDRRWLRRAAVLVAVLLALAAVGVGGSLLGSESAVPRSVPSAVVGRTSTVCAVPTADADPSASPTPSGESSSPPSATPGSTPATPSPTPATPSPSASAANEAAPSAVSAVAVRGGVTGKGTLTGSVLRSGAASAAPDLRVTEPGHGERLAQASGPVLLTGEGAMASAGSGVVSSSATSGEMTGLMAAPCLVPGTEQWLVGVGATDTDRTELILTNPDEAEAEVDLRFYGPKGRVVVPGSPGVVIAGRSTRTVSVSSLVDTPGPLSVAVRASSGRASVAARRIRTDNLQPAGADWQVPSTGPATTVVIPGVPGGAGSRSLQVVNPGTKRAEVAVEVLGLAGAFAPAGADTVEVAPESTATVGLETGLAGESGSIRLRSDTPVSGAVVSTSSRSGATPDLAVQSATPPLVRSGVSAVATTADGTASELVLSNSGDADAATSFEVLSYEGVSLRKDDILLAAGGTATRRITSPGPSYVVVTVPDGSSVVGSVTLTAPEGDVAALATIPLTSPDVASRAPRVEQDPAVAR